MYKINQDEWSETPLFHQSTHKPKPTFIVTPPLNHCADDNDDDDAVDDDDDDAVNTYSSAGASAGTN